MAKNIMIVDDSALMRRILCDIISSNNRYEVTDTCKNGQEALLKLRTKSYDAVLLDVNMPVMDGLQLLEQLQKENIETTVIMVSTLTAKDADITIRAMELGAADFITKPENIFETKGKEFADNLFLLLGTVLRSANCRHLLTKSAGNISSAVSSLSATKSASSDKRSSRAIPTAKGLKLIALASSTGGPKALQSVIPHLPENMDAPMVLVQHMPAGFTASMARRLNELSKVEVKEAEDGDILKKGVVYIAAGGRHMRIIPSGSEHIIRLSEEPPVSGLRPCADIMYESLLDCRFDSICCVVLTGMGSDGTRGISQLAMHCKGVFTIAQDADTCVVYGMPKSVNEAGLANEVVPLEKVAGTIIRNIGVR